MCGRFALIESFEKLKAFYGARNEVPWRDSYNIAPSQNILAVVQNDREREFRLMKWGLVPHWAKEEKIGFKMINARSETVDEKPGFRDSFKSRRCIIPASGFYEWQKPDKQPFWFTPAEGVFSFCGLWASWKRPDGSVLESCTILTTAANDVVAPIHDRMPVAIGHNAVGAWLDKNTPASELKELLAPFPAAQMSLLAVSKYVNKPQNSGPNCIIENSA